MAEDPGNRNERDLLRLVRLASALCMGGVAGFLCSVRQLHPNLRFGFSAVSIVGFVMAAGFAWVCFGCLFREAAESAAGPPGRRGKPIRRWLMLFGVVSGLATLGGFVYALKDVAGEELRNVIEGAALAVAVLVTIGWLLRRVVRLLEEESRIHDDHRGEE